MAICGGGPGAKCTSISCLLMMVPGPRDEAHPATKTQLATKKANDHARRLAGSFNALIVTRIQVWKKAGLQPRLGFFGHFGSSLLRAKVLAASAPTNTNKPCAVMISRRFARAYFLFCLVVVHTLFDAL